MFILYAEKNQLKVLEQERVTSGSVRVYRARFEFSSDWEGMTKTACFRSGSQIVSVRLDSSGECDIPWEITDPDDARKRLSIGVRGTRDGDVVLPTVWADCGTILEGVGLGTNARPATPDLLEQALGQKADGIELDGRELRLTSNGKALARVTLPGADGPSDEETATEDDMRKLLDEVFGAP